MQPLSEFIMTHDKPDTLFSPAELIMFTLRHILRASDPARLPVQLAGRWGQKKLNRVRRGKNYFVQGRLEQPRQDKTSLVQAQRAQ